MPGRSGDGVRLRGRDGTGGMGDDPIRDVEDPGLEADEPGRVERAEVDSEPAREAEEAARDRPLLGP